MTPLLTILITPFQEIARWILWWYGPGLLWMARWLVKEIRENEQHTHWIKWVLAIFTPMYGQRDRAGRMISFAVRAVVLGYKSLWSMVWIILHSIFFISYAVFPVVSLAMVIATFV